MRDRIGLVEAIPAQAAAGEIDREAAVAALKDIAWANRLPSGLRAPALRGLIDEGGLLDDPERIELLRRLLPTERERGVTATAARVIADRGWTELTPMLVRRFAREEPGVPDTKRVERAALLTLHPDQTLEEIVFEVFLRHGPRSEVELAEKVRRDAWDLLSRLDADGEARVELLGDLAARDADPNRDPLMASLRRGLLELRAIPLTGEQLEWLLELNDIEDIDAEPWWEASNEIIRTLDQDQRRGLRLRHAEPLRIAAEVNRERTRVSRGALLDVLEQRLADRTQHRRVENTRVRQDLDAWRDELTFGDLVSVLTVDDAIAEPRVRLALFEQVDEDRADTTTEYGGVLQVASRRSSLGRFAAVSYPPRPATRQNDRTFIASREMLSENPRAFAHYHFHVQREKNAGFAGPSAADQLYARRYGRTCVVFTSIDRRTLNADVYLPNGVVIDLGEVKPYDEVLP